MEARCRLGAKDLETGIQAREPKSGRIRNGQSRHFTFWCREWDEPSAGARMSMSDTAVVEGGMCWVDPEEHWLLHDVT